MRWTYEKPSPSLLVSDGSTLWIYDPAFGEAQKLPVGEGYLSGASIQFLLGDGDIRGEFAVEALACSAQVAELELVPIQPASYEKLRVQANPATGELLSTQVFDLFGNVTDVRFSNLEADQRPGAEVFRFEPPPGVKVLELDGGSG
jgi:outer membrane lipoprotein carrier protein